MTSEPETQTHNAIADTDPFGLFGQWFAAARDSEPNDPEAVALASASPSGAPSVRMVLLKDWGPDGFIFYTNAHSRKGAELLANSQAAMLFHWKSLRRQIRIEGVIQEVSPTLADAYFASRSRSSQIGAVASDQSSPLATRADFLARIAETEARFAAAPVARPAHWSGFRLVPAALEFWLDRQYRLHERRRFVRAGPAAPWTSSLLYP